MAPALIVMAAGIGSRYGGLKQADPVGPGKEIIIDYSIYDAIKAGFKDIVIIIRRDIEKIFREKVGKNIESKAKVIYVFQELQDIPEKFAVPKDRIKPWGTGQAVLACADAVSSNFAVINADDFYGASSYKILYKYLETAADKNGLYDWCLVGYTLSNTLSEHGYVSRGVCGVGKNNYITEINERLKIKRFGAAMKYTEDNVRWVELAPDSIASMNMWGFTPGLFKELERGFAQFLEKNLNNIKAEYLLPVFVGQLIKENRAKVQMLSTAEKWYGVTYPEDMPVIKLAIKEMISKGLYPEKLWGRTGHD